MTKDNLSTCLPAPQVKTPQKTGRVTRLPGSRMPSWCAARTADAVGIAAASRPAHTAEQSSRPLRFRRIPPPFLKYAPSSAFSPHRHCPPAALVKEFMPTLEAVQG